MAISFGVCCIENSLPSFFLILVPFIIVWLRRDDYTRGVFFSEPTLVILIVPYVLFVSLWHLSNPDNSYTLPHFFAFFSSGVFLIRVMGPLPDRHVGQLFFLSVGLTLVNCILTNHFMFALALLFYLFFMMAGLLAFTNAKDATRSHWIEKPPIDEKKGLKRLIGPYALILGVGILIFLLFPRPFLIFRGLSPTATGQGAMASLRDRISYDEMVGMGDRRRIAFKAKMKVGSLPPYVYWRGRVLERYDEKGWSAIKRKSSSSRPVKFESSRLISYEIYPYRLHTNYVYVAGLPQWVSARFGMTLHINADREVVIDSDFLYSDVYEVKATLRPIPVGPDPDRVNLETEGIPPGIKRLAEQWSKDADDNEAVANAFVARLKSGYKYELAPEPAGQGANPLEYFLTQSRTGNCEYFSGALALLLRSSGIPARVVEGFYGLEHTDAPDEYLVRFTRAHAWVEADLDGKNWTRLDPTPISQYAGRADSIFDFLSDYYDEINHLWVTTVVNYDRSDQRRFVRTLRSLVVNRGAFAHGIKSRLKAAGVWAAILAGLTVSAILIIMMLRARSSGPARIYENTMKDLKRIGILSEAHPWHEMNRERILERSPGLEKPLNDFLEIYMRARFGDLPHARIDDLRRAGERLTNAAREAR
jgi:transglutaminase-like putative cysteine protease